MNLARFAELTCRYPRLRIAIVGDFCLDRYFDIDPARQEISIETGLPVHNITRVRCQPGAAGTILNNLVALGIGEIYPVGFCGEDGEGFELRRSLKARTGVRLDYFVQTGERRTFTYTKPLVCAPGKAPVELSRLDIKNWTPTPAAVQDQIIGTLFELATKVDAMILMDQVDLPETGVVTARLLETIREAVCVHPNLPIVADSRRGLRGFPPVIFKMNGAELAALTGTASDADVETIMLTARKLAAVQRRAVIVTLAERGILGATPTGEVAHVPVLPIRGEIDIVGAGDSVTANLTAALAAGAKLLEAIEMANAAASIVIHQLGTTGTASVDQIECLLRNS
ncbi:MAG: carbohydrate kinase [Verrucomicrobia bacterium]|nr:carbohydrate kinase [Verrucomicrobiota bacterium]